MPQKQKINLEKVMASLNTVCPKCGCSIAPDKIRRIDSLQMECPECGVSSARRISYPMRQWQRQ